MEERKDYYVYEHRFTNGIVFYVGQGCRYRDINTFNRNTKWYELTKDVSYTVHRIKENLSEIESLELEKELILKYGRLDKETGTLCNKNDGGIGGKGEDNYFFGKQLFGKDNGNFGNKFANNSLSIPIYRLDLQGNILYAYESAKEAEEVYGYISNNITECCNGKRGLHKGYQFIKQQNYTEPENHIYIPRKTDKQPIIQLQLINENECVFIKYYESSQAVEIDGYNAKCVNACANGSKKTHKNFYWKKLVELEPDFQKHIMNEIESNKI